MRQIQPGQEVIDLFLLPVRIRNSGYMYSLFAYLPLSFSLFFFGAVLFVIAMPTVNVPIFEQDIKPNAITLRTRQSRYSSTQEYDLGRSIPSIQFLRRAPRPKELGCGFLLVLRSTAGMRRPKSFILTVPPHGVVLLLLTVCRPSYVRLLLTQTNLTRAIQNAPRCSQNAWRLSRTS